VRDGGRVKKERIRVGKIGEGLRVWKRGRVKGRKKREGLRVRKGYAIPFFPTLSPSPFPHP
jgi:hypothetical protein